MKTMRRSSSLLVYFAAVVGAASALSSPSSSSSVTSSISSSSGPSSSAAAASSSPVVIRSHTLRGRNIDDDEEEEEGIGGHRESMTMHEIRPSPRNNVNYEEEDEVEQFYPTQRRAFSFPDIISDPYRKADGAEKKKVLNVRQTSFGCGRLGATVWPSSIALACLLAADPGLVEGRRVVELGSGCGLPSLVAKEVCGAGKVLATDYWELPPPPSNDDDDDKKKLLLPIIGNDDKGERLVPRDLFGANLAHNVGANENDDDDNDNVSVRRLDWHDEMGVFKIANDFRPEVIIGSDLVYYPMDTKPLLRTLEILLLGNNDGDDDDGDGDDGGGCGGGGAREALLVSPLPPGADREALPEFRRMLMGEEEEGIGSMFGDAFDVDMDEMDMDDRRPADEVGERLHSLLRIRIRRRR